jgi:hypothetical protein
LAAALEQLGVSLTRTEKTQVMLFADVDESGTIDWVEFIRSFDVATGVPPPP